MSKLQVQCSQDVSTRPPRCRSTSDQLKFFTKKLVEEGMQDTRTFCSPTSSAGLSSYTDLPACSAPSAPPLQ